MDDMSDRDYSSRTNPTQAKNSKTLDTGGWGESGRFGPRIDWGSTFKPVVSMRDGDEEVSDSWGAWGISKKKKREKKAARVTKGREIITGYKPPTCVEVPDSPEPQVANDESIELPIQEIAIAENNNKPENGSGTDKAPSSQPMVRPEEPSVRQVRWSEETFYSEPMVGPEKPSVLQVKGSDLVTPPTPQPVGDSATHTESRVSQATTAVDNQPLSKLTPDHIQLLMQPRRNRSDRAGDRPSSPVTTSNREQTTFSRNLPGKRRSTGHCCDECDDNRSDEEGPWTREVLPDDSASRQSFSRRRNAVATLPTRVEAKPGRSSERPRLNIAEHHPGSVNRKPNWLARRSHYATAAAPRTQRTQSRAESFVTIDSDSESDGAQQHEVRHSRKTRLVLCKDPWCTVPGCGEDARARSMEHRFYCTDRNCLHCSSIVARGGETRTPGFEDPHIPVPMPYPQYTVPYSYLYPQVQPGTVPGQFPLWPPGTTETATQSKAPTGHQPIPHPLAPPAHDLIPNSLPPPIPSASAKSHTAPITTANAKDPIAIVEEYLAALKPVKQQELLEAHRILSYIDNRTRRSQNDLVQAPDALSFLVDEDDESNSSEDASTVDPSSVIPATSITTSSPRVRFRSQISGHGRARDTASLATSIHSDRISTNRAYKPPEPAVEAVDAVCCEREPGSLPSGPVNDGRGETASPELDVLRREIAALKKQLECGDDMFADLPISNNNEYQEMLAFLTSLSTATNGSGLSSDLESGRSQSDLTSSQPSLNGFSNGTRPTSTFGSSGTYVGSSTSQISLQQPPSILERKYLELCVNTGPYETHLAEILLTPTPTSAASTICTDAHLFRLIHARYFALRKRTWRRFLYRPAGIKFIHFGVSAGHRVDFFSSGSPLPTEEALAAKRYEYNLQPPVPPPMDSRTFLHYFWKHGAHAHSTSARYVNRLPKKVGESLVRGLHTDELREGWGIHILEGPNKSAVCWALLAVLAVSLGVAVGYDVLMKEGESGFAIGQWMVAALAVGLSGVYFGLQDEVLTGGEVRV